MRSRRRCRHGFISSVRQLIGSRLSYRRSKTTQHSRAIRRHDAPQIIGQQLPSPLMPPRRQFDWLSISRRAIFAGCWHAADVAYASRAGHASILKARHASGRFLARRDARCTSIERRRKHRMQALAVTLLIVGTTISAGDIYALSAQAAHAYH